MSWKYDALPDSSAVAFTSTSFFLIRAAARLACADTDQVESQVALSIRTAAPLLGCEHACGYVRGTVQNKEAPPMACFPVFDVSYLCMRISAGTGDV